MAIFHPPPPVFTGGGQPYGHVEQTPPSNPPPPFVPSVRVALIASVLAAWAPADPPPAIISAKLAPPTSAALAWLPSPPSEVTAQILSSAWQSPDSQPVRSVPPKMAWPSAASLGWQPVSRASLITGIAQSWLPPDPLPALNEQLPRATTESFAWKPRPNQLFPAGQVDTAPWEQSEPLTAAPPGWSIDSPPRIAQRQFAWPDDPPAFQLSRKFVPAQTSPANNPPGYSVAALPDLLTDWWRVDPVFQWRVFLTPSGVAITALPPRRFDLASTLAAWQVGDPQPALSSKLPWSTAASLGWQPRPPFVQPQPADDPIIPQPGRHAILPGWSVDNPPFAQTRLIPYPETPAQPDFRPVRTPFAPPVVNNPPAYSTALFPAVLECWWRQPQMPVVRVFFTPSGSVVTRIDPCFAAISEVKSYASAAEATSYATPAEVKSYTADGGSC